MDAKVTRVDGRGAVLRGDDIDTDRIMPARFLRAITFEGMEQHVFEDDRKTTKHPVDDSRYQGASPWGRTTISPGSTRSGSQPFTRTVAPPSVTRWNGTRCSVPSPE